MEPVMKWAGGKRKLLPAIKNHIDIKWLEGHNLYEPFIGGGALTFDLTCSNSIINDLNKELINVYIQIKKDPEGLIKLLKKHKKNNSHDYYYMVRNIDRESKFKRMSDLEKAARTIYLNRVCYNGLYRVNSKGQFNVPFGRYKNPEIVFEDKIRKMSAYLNQNGVVIRNLDFEDSVNDAKGGDVVYFDPPYDYENEGFTSYTKNGFTRDDLKRLKEVCDRLINIGCHVIISNNDTKYVNELFNDKRYEICHITANRMINCDGKKRSAVKEVIIYG